MAAVANGHPYGHTPQYVRFSGVPAVIDIPVRGEDGDEAVNLDLTELLDETDELCDLLENESAGRNYWITIALAYVKQKKLSVAVDILQKGLQAQSRGRSEDRLALLAALCWLYLARCRSAPRVRPTAPTPPAAGGDAVLNGAAGQTKDYWLHQATSTLNEASRINPSYPPLFLARGTLYLLRASLQPSRSAAGGASEHSERTETLKQAAKCFDDAYKHSSGKNLMAMLGKAKVQFSLARYAESLAIYQQVLTNAPDLDDPDPRIGIGCCLWALGHKEHARSAWQRSLDLNPHVNVPANILLGISYLDETNHYATSDPEFGSLYKKAMTQHTQTAFKLNPMHALTCATFSSYFLLRKTWANAERLARRAIEQTDVNAVASDGWYLLARKEHYEGSNLAQAADYYNKADQARGGDDRGYLPAKFGAAQIRTLLGDLDGAKFRLDKIVAAPGAVQTAGANKSIEAMTLLGILYAEEVFANQAAGGKEDKTAEQRKAIALLEQVRVAWKDPKRKLSPDASVLLNLAGLYEQESPGRALACLLQVEEMELAEIQDDDDRLPDEIGDAEEERRAKRELLSPQLLNNIGCFHFHADKFTLAREDFQTALSSCVKMGERDSELDTDALVTSISYNLARTYEAEGLRDEAKGIYDGLLGRHPDYIDAGARLAYISLSDPSTASVGTESLKNLLAANPANLDLRALYAHHLSRTKKRVANLAEDPEQRFYKETLQKHDKHDLYSLLGMGNLHLSIAREMRKETDQDKERRSKQYVRAVEFFDKVLTLDPKNAWAAQGVGIAVTEDKKDVNAGIQIFSKVRESLKGVASTGSVFLNLGHVFAELRQWSRSIENYDLALSRSARERLDGNPDPAILACLGRVWLMRGRQEKNLEAYKTSLDLSRQALALQPENVSFRFNVAFVQSQMAQLLISLPEAQKSLADVEEAVQGLEQSIEVFADIAKGPTPPFPRADLEARANMGRNTMKRQLQSVVEKQAEYERKNADRLEEARRKREEGNRKREEEKRRAAEAAEAERRKIREERERLAEETKEEMARREAEEKAREEAEYTTDAETGERKKREKRPREKRQKRKKKSDEDEDSTMEEEGVRRSRATSGTPATGASDGEAPRRREKKKRKLERKGQATKASSKYKSAERIEDSDEEDREMGGVNGAGAGEEEREEETPAVSTPGGVGGEDGEEEEEEEHVSRPSQRRKGARVVDDDEEEDHEESMEDGTAAAAQVGDDAE